jgi:hypothetical protein
VHTTNPYIAGSMHNEQRRICLRVSKLIVEQGTG